MEWISIKDKLPESGKPVLVWNGGLDLEYHIGVYVPGAGWSTNRDSYDLDYVTHWMPLPAAPRQ